MPSPAIELWRAVLSRAETDSDQLLIRNFVTLRFLGGLGLDIVMGWIGSPHGTATCWHLRLLQALQALQLLHTMATNVEICELRDLQATLQATSRSASSAKQRRGQRRGW